MRKKVKPPTASRQLSPPPLNRIRDGDNSAPHAALLLAIVVGATCEADSFLIYTRDGHRDKKPRLDHLNWEQIEQRFLGERVTMNTKEENAFLEGGLGGWVPGNLD